MTPKKSIFPNGIATLQAASLPSAHHGASQTASHRPGCRPRVTGRKWGLHLVRRNQVFHFRRRWPEKIRRRGAPAFLSVSLRTQVLSDAVKRSAGLPSAVEAGERDVLTELQGTPVNVDGVRAMSQNMVRRAVARMIARQEGDTPVSDPEVHLKQIAAEGAQIREARRARDRSVASTFAGEIEPPRVYQRRFGSTVRLLFHLRSSSRRKPPQLLVA